MKDITECVLEAKKELKKRYITKKVILRGFEIYNQSKKETK